MTVELHVKNKAYNGVFGGVRFNRGVGVFTDVKLAHELAKEYGHTVHDINNSTINTTIESTINDTIESTNDGTIVKPKRTRKVKSKVGE